MKLRNIALILALVATGTAFAATTETSVTRETPRGTVTRHVVRVNNNHHVNRAVVHRAPLHRHFRHATHRRPVIVVRHS
jgi:hypothetical protein